MSWFHSFISRSYIKEIDSLTFGRYTSDSYGEETYAIYNLSKDQLFIDKREIWGEQNTFNKTYTFRGQLASNEKFEIAKKLLHKVPKEIYNEKWKCLQKNFGHYQDILIVEISKGTEKTTVLIDDYIIDRLKLPNSLLTFRKLVEATLKKLKE